MSPELIEMMPMIEATGVVESAVNACRLYRSRRFCDAENLLCRAILLNGLDRKVASGEFDLTPLDAAIGHAISVAFGDDGYYEQEREEANLFLQRTLYRIYRMKLFWYDDLRNYVNERSAVLRAIRDRIEEPWQAWELEQVNPPDADPAAFHQEISRRAALDFDPPLDETGRYFCEKAGEEGYRELLAITSLDGLVEASQLSRTLGGPGNPVHAVMTRLLTEEYGFGRLARKHSSFFSAMLSGLGMQTEPEAYFDRVPWEVLATINHSFLLSERKRHFLRYVGGLLYTEISVPAAFAPYRAAAQRLGLPIEATTYWDLHIKVDQAHGRWMLDDVALPLAERYPEDAWEILLGYDQARLMGGRAGRAIRIAAESADAA